MASDIVADARRWLDVRNGRVSTHSENCHQWHAECLVARLVEEVERHRMTPEERHAANYCSAYSSHSEKRRAVFLYLDRTATEEVHRE